MLGAAPLIMYLPIFLYGGTTIRDVMMDYGNAKDSFIRYHQEYQPDLAWGPQIVFPGPALEGLDCQFLKRPGKQIQDPNGGFQVVGNKKTRYVRG